MWEVSWDDPNVRAQQQIMAADLAKNSESCSPTHHGGPSSDEEIRLRHISKGGPSSDKEIRTPRVSKESKQDKVELAANVGENFTF